MNDRKLTILVIEDNAPMRENIAEILELADYKVVTAGNGKEGVETAISVLPDLIVCDIMMPELNGYGVLHLLSKKDATSRIPFIFLTAKTDRDDLRKGMNLGADDYITKPFDESDLLDAIEIRIKRSEILKQEYDREAHGLAAFYNDAKGTADLKSLTFNREIRNYKKKEMVYLQDNFPHALFYVNRGKLKLYKTNNDGKEFVVSIISEGEFVGILPLFKNCAYKESAMALEECSISVISKDDFFNLILNNRDVALKFIHVLTDTILDREDELIRLAYNTVRKRVADGLLKLSDSYQRNEMEGFPVYREDLANIVGTASESVIRVLGEFKEMKLISAEGRTIRILDYEGLSGVRF